MTDQLMSTPPESRVIREFSHRDYPIERILEHKAGTTVSVCLPARNEASTVGSIVRTISTELLDVGAIDEVVVIDDHSADQTAAVAREAGARVVAAAEVLGRFGPGHGKGEVLWKSLYVTEGDLVIWCDSDIAEFGSRFVTGILGPLLCESGVDIAKGYYRRPQNDGEGGGRVTELVARPLLSLFYPDLAGLYQPLSGEYGGRRSVLEQLPFVEGYGVEIGLLIDYFDKFGLDPLVQVDLDVRHHRNRDLAELGPQALAIMQTVLRHVDPLLAPRSVNLLRPEQTPVTLESVERPPMIDVAQYRTRRSNLRAVET